MESMIGLELKGLIYELGWIMISGNQLTTQCQFMELVNFFSSQFGGHGQKSLVVKLLGCQVERNLDKLSIV